jgi:hypothetical protein
MNRRRWTRIGVVGLVAVAMLILGGQAVRMHRDSGEWRFTQSATPHRIHVGDRDYERSELPPVALPAGYEAQGSTQGGGTVYVPSDAVVTPEGEVVVPLIVYVRVDGAHDVVNYGLVGGP